MSVLRDDVTLSLHNILEDQILNVDDLANFSMKDVKHQVVRISLLYLKCMYVCRYVCIYIYTLNIVYNC